MTNNITITTAVAVLLLMLPCCDNRQQTTQTKKRTAHINTHRPEETIVAGTENGMLGIADARELTVKDIITFELNVLKNEYKYHHQFFMPDWVTPICEQCSDLEFLLILERNIDSFKGLNRDKILYPYRDLIDPVYIDIPNGHIYGVSYLANTDEAVIKDRLRGVEQAYTEKFDASAPWWWVCSVEERITRLEKAIKTNKEYPDYPGADDRWYYMLGKTMAAYEMWFKRPLPVCTQTWCNADVTRLNHAKTALVAGLPYLSEKEDALLKNRLKAEYKKKASVSISKYWLSVARIHYSWENYNAGSVEHVVVTRTADGGALAKTVRVYGNGTFYNSLELAIDDWVNFVNALDALGVDTWEKQEDKRPHYTRRGSGNLKIATLNGDRGYFREYCVGNIEIREISEYTDILPPNWAEFKKVIKTMQARIEKDGKRNY
jgi:hypothetical protein